MNDRKHSITIIFPLMLFLLFVSLAVSVILIAARIYERNVASSNDNFLTRTTISYLTEKIRAFDESDGVRVGEFDGENALILSEKIDGTLYHTYIYQQDSSLCELTAPESEGLTRSAGSPILAVEQVSFTQHGQTITIACPDAYGEMLQTTVTLRSAQKD